MPSRSAGEIALDLVVNKKPFQKQMQGIQSLAKNAAAALASAFAVKGLIDFGAECIELGSDLAEVQNVVDVTFPQMREQVNAFAKDAITSFGLSETMAKQFTGTFGAMAKAFGFNEQAAYEMSTTLAGLAGDVASFYNITQDEAYTKLKSVFTGETESLKDLGIVMTQTALDSYALANGFGKTTANMSEMEKVALRYQFVQEQLSGASGDFLRTSDGWANQVRVLNLQIDSLKASIGQGLINVLTPVLKLINTLIGRLMTLANAFKAFTELITGKKSETTQAGIVAEDAGMASEALEGTADAAKKAKKATASTGIDELNIISTQSDNGDTGSIGTGMGSEIDFGELAEGETVIDSADEKMAGLLDRAKELAGIFAAGFWDGFGDLSVLDSVSDSLMGIRTRLTELFTSPEIQSAAGTLAETLMSSLGTITGAVLSVGATIADNLFGGIRLYLDQNGQSLQNHLVAILDLGTRASELFARASETAAVIFSAFRSEPAQQISADLLGIFTDAFLGTKELAVQFGLDVIDLIVSPLEDNRDLIRDSLEAMFSAVEPVISELRSLVEEAFTKAKKIYDDSIAPIFDSFQNGLSKIVKKLTEGWNTYILPIIEEFGERFQVLREEYLSPLIDKIVEFADKVSEAVITVWENVLMPLIQWIIDTLYPVIAEKIQGLIDLFFIFWEGISEAVGYILDALGGLMDFITGIFTGNWETAWTGIKDFFQGIWDAIKVIVDTIWEAIVSVFETTLEQIRLLWETVWGTIRDFFSDIWDALSKEVSEKFGAIRDFIKETLNNIKTWFSDVWNSIKTTVSNLINGIKSVITTAMTAIRNGITTALTAIRNKFASIFTGIKNTVTNIFEGMWKSIKGVINSILGGIEGMANGVVRGVNRVIGALNNLSFDIPDWIPGLGGKTFGFNIPTLGEISIPRLADGGFVPANTPQLAMIGDNRRYGEIVAPEDKLQEMVDKAVLMANSQNLSDQYLSIMVDLLKQIISLIENLDLVVNIDIREIRRKLKDLEKRSGFAFNS